MTTRQWRLDYHDGGVLKTRWFDTERAFDRAVARLTPGKFVGWEVWPTVLEGESMSMSEVEAVLAAHPWHPVFGCECTPEDDETGVKDVLDVSWERHVAGLLKPALEERP